ncbi:MAG: plastocyanin/azurin family copper-binding protein [Candidatus Peribacteraceae bacterium]
MQVMNVSLRNHAYTPARLTVKIGTQVTWKNNEESNVPHTVTRNQGQQGPLSGVMTKGETYSYTFTATGSYAYHCAFHPTMTGSVVVTK